MDGTLQIEHIKKERENGGSFACVTLWCPLFATHGSRPSAFYGYWLHPMGFKVLFLNTKHWHICPERTQGGARMLAGSCVVTLGWSEWQEARRGSDLGKGKQEGHHALGCSSECGHHAWSVQGPPNLCSCLPHASEGGSKDGVSEQGAWPWVVIFWASIICQVL